MMRHRYTVSLVLQVALLLGLGVAATAQSSPTDNKKSTGDERGWTSYLEFDGSHNSTGSVYNLTPSVGYDFSRHFGLTAGVPIYMIRGSSSTGGTDTNGLGDPYLGLLFRFPNHVVNYRSAVIGGVPLGDTDKGLSTGRFTIDWDNRFDHSFGRLTPFFDAGLGNSLRDTRFFQRPFTTLGFVSHFEGGADVDVWKFFSVGGSLYAVEPSGQQKVFSKVVPRGAEGHSGSHGKAFGVEHLTVGGSDLVRDHGFSTWIDANPRQILDLELAYSRSMDFDLNTVSFTVGLNVARILRRSQPRQ
jgi:hypothetical protein